MSHDYFYDEPPDGFAFYRIPKILFTDERYGGISVEAKLLYGLLLDRVKLSQEHEWFDKLGRVFIIFSLKDVMKFMGCSDNKAMKLLRELEDTADLIERHHQGQGKADRIFVKNFVDNSVKKSSKVDESQAQSRKIDDSGFVNSTGLGPSKSRPINNDITNKNTDIYPIPSGFPVDCSRIGRERIRRDRLKRGGTERDVKAREKCRELLEKQLDYAVLLHDHPYEKGNIDELLGLMLDVICSKNHEIHIAGDDKPLEVVKNQFHKINKEHIEYVLSSLAGNKSKVKNIRGYLLTALYNAPLTMTHFYDALVRSDNNI